MSRDAPRFLTVEEVEALHKQSLNEHGGSSGTRDQSGLESAVLAAFNIFLYHSEDRYEIAAGYAFHLAESQAFLDGNKRTAIASALVFLGLNGVDLSLINDPMKLYEPMIDVAEGKIGRSELAEIFRNLIEVS